MKDKPVEYFLKHVEQYDLVIVLSYTPCFLIKEEQKTPIKQRYTDALLKRCRSGKGKTIIYAAESGLNSIRNKSQESLSSNLAIWNGLVDFSNQHPDNLKIYVVKDEFLSSVSFILAHVPEKSLGERAPWDVLIGYHVGLKPEQLFGANENAVDSSEYEYRLVTEDTLPEGIDFILKKLNNKSSVVDFGNWIASTKIQEALSPPKVAVISAMSIEVQYYRKGLTAVLVDRLPPGHQQGKFLVGNSFHTIDFPPTSYGRIKTNETVNNVCRQFRDLRTLVFVGCAGGDPYRVKKGDVVISTDILDLTHEKLFLKSGEKTVAPRKGLLELSPISLELRVNPYNIDDDLYKIAQGICDKIEQDRWRNLVDRYLDYCTTPEERKVLFLPDHPKIHLGKIWSSDHNINDEGFRDILAKEYHVTAFEMEGGGFAEGAKSRGKRFIEIRGISDYGDGDRSEDDKWQRIALAVASACTEALLYDLLVNDGESNETV